MDLSLHRIFSIVLATLFALFLVVIIVSADMGRLGSFLSLVRYVPGKDFTGHLVLLGTMSLLLNTALRFKTFRWGSWNILVGTVILLVVGTTEEISQLFFVSRSFSFHDMLGNTIGIILFGQFGYWRSQRFQPEFVHKPEPDTNNEAKLS